MKALTVSEFQDHVTELLELVKKGERIQITQGDSNEPVALLIPHEKAAKRTIGLLEGKASFTFSGDGKISAEEFLVEENSA